MRRFLFIALCLLVWLLSSEKAPGADEPPQAPSLPPAQAPTASYSPQPAKHHEPGHGQSYNERHDLATEQGKPLVVWVGLECPACERQLTQAVHCHVTTLRGSDAPRVVVGVYRDGKLWHAGSFPGLPSAAALKEAATGNGPQLVTANPAVPVAAPLAMGGDCSTGNCGVPAGYGAFQAGPVFGGFAAGGGCAGGNCGGSSGGGRGRRGR